MVTKFCNGTCAWQNGSDDRSDPHAGRANCEPMSSSVTVRTLVLIPAADVLILCALGRLQHAPGPCVDVLLLRCKDMPQLLRVNALGHIGVSVWSTRASTDAFASVFKFAVNNHCVAGKPTDAFVAGLQQERAERSEVFNIQGSYVKHEAANAKWHEINHRFTALPAVILGFTPEVQELTHALWHSRKRRDTLHAQVRCSCRVRHSPWVAMWCQGLGQQSTRAAASAVAASIRFAQPTHPLSIYTVHCVLCVTAGMLKIM